MATVEHPIGLNSEQHRAFAAKVFWQTVGIVNLVRVQWTTPPVARSAANAGSEHFK